MNQTILEKMYERYMKESEFNAKGELSFGHKFKLVARKNKIIWIYSTNKDLIHDFPEFQYTSESEKEAKAVYDESLLIRLIEYIK